MEILADTGYQGMDDAAVDGSPVQASKGLTRTFAGRPRVQATSNT